MQTSPWSCKQLVAEVVRLLKNHGYLRETLPVDVDFTTRDVFLRDTNAYLLRNSPKLHDFGYRGFLQR